MISTPADRWTHAEQGEITDVKELCKAAAFVLTTLDGTTAGVGLLCCDCRYASVLWPGDQR